MTGKENGGAQSYLVKLIPCGVPLKSAWHINDHELSSSVFSNERCTGTVLAISNSSRSDKSRKGII
jgi:hypothetical protein